MCTDSKHHDPETYAIIGAAMQVHKTLGSGFLKAVYHEALEIEFRQRGIPYQSGVQLPIHYDNTLLKTSYHSDFLCYGSIIVDINALPSDLTGTEQSQIINCLKASRLTKGLLFNFGKSSLEYKRQALSQNQSAPSA